MSEETSGYHCPECGVRTDIKFVWQEEVLWLCKKCSTIFIVVTASGKKSV